MSSFCLQMEGISKRFPGVRALNAVDFDLLPGEVHALVGENGAGKSTLMKILGGAYIPDGGCIRIDGKDVQIKSPSNSMAMGVSIIYQEFNLVPSLSVAENMFLGKEKVKGKSPSLDRRSMEEAAAGVMARLGMKDVDCSKPVRTLSVARQQLVEIGKAVFNNARILVMDEPTAVLSRRESESLFRLIEDLKAEEIAVVYISHRLEEVLALSDRITVLRDGEVVTRFDNHEKQVSEDDLVSNMVGRELKDIFPERSDVLSGEKVLEVDSLAKTGLFSDVSFSVSSGEIVGFSGLVGSGRTEIMKSLSGFYGWDSGAVFLDGKAVVLKDTARAISRGIVLVPEDRKQEGLILKMTLGENMVLPVLKSLSSYGHILKKTRKKLIEEYLEKLRIRPALPRRQINHFSGGNQQKTVIAKWLATEPRVIIFDEPTRGIDIGAKVEIYKLIDELARRGTAIIFISSELMEVMGMCDRIYTVYNGTISGEFSREGATQEELMRAASGL